MVGLEIVMNIDTLEIFDVIDHDKDGNSEQEPTTIIWLNDVHLTEGDKLGWTEKRYTMN